jgi:4-hydroxyphenylpyruvate dioxygenase
MATETARRPLEAVADEMPLLGIDHVELYVGNGVQSAYWFNHALGFRETAYAGLETGVRDRASHVLEQGRVRFVLTSPLLGTTSPLTATASG